MLKAQFNTTFEGADLIVFRDAWAEFQTDGPRCSIVSDR